jgi:hypothetical protein
MEQITMEIYNMKTITLPLSLALELMAGYKEKIVVTKELAAIFSQADPEGELCHVEPSEANPKLATVYTIREWKTSQSRHEKVQQLSSQWRERRTKHREAQEVVRVALSKFGILGDSANLMIESIASNKANAAMLSSFGVEPSYTEAFFDKDSVTSYPNFDKLL